MTTLAQRERHLLCDLLDEVGEGAPTLCGEWSTGDLAAHLVLRERRPDAALGIVMGPLAGHTATVQAGLRRRLPWPTLVDSVRGGPPFLLRPADTAMNTVEYFVHHEDVRRAGTGWAPRTLAAEDEAVLFAKLRAFSKMAARRSPVPFTLVAPGHGELSRGSGDGRVTVEGAPSELLLYLFGRKDQAAVALTGADADVARFRDADLSL